jgi:hypothetical protein
MPNARDSFMHAGSLLLIKVSQTNFSQIEKWFGKAEYNCIGHSR